MFKLVGIKNNDGLTGIAVQSKGDSSIYLVGSILNPNSTEEKKDGKLPDGYRCVWEWARRNEVRLDKDSLEAGTIGLLCAYAMTVVMKAQEPAKQRSSQRELAKTTA